MTTAAQAQIAAANPTLSTWLSANAGAGKTRVLTDRVARLLLRGVPPERILCLTYTKAAAMEMQNRLFANLGAWAMRDDDALRAALDAVGEPRDALTPTVLAQARTLFARAIEAPGGLKIQTIHSFCATLLRRFPLEAGISPGFTEIDDRAQARLIVDVLDAMAITTAGQTAIDGVAAHLNDDDGLVHLAKSVAKQAETLHPPLDWAALCTWFEIDPMLDDATLVAMACGGISPDLVRTVCALFDPQKRGTERKIHRTLAAFDPTRATLSDVAMLEDIFLFGAGAKTKTPFTAKIGAFGNAKIRQALGKDLAALEAWMMRVEAVRPQRLAYLTARRTVALHDFAAQFLPAYRAAKQTRGWLDFDDLITHTGTLLSAPDVAGWVLFRLDGGIDHILIDEAQDTSPQQWNIVARLAEDFAAGQGARAGTLRTLFVVGDKKQSIYSFQGADPQEFDRMRTYFTDRLAQIRAPFQNRDLLYSFRSAPPILTVVDGVAAGTGLGPDVQHQAFFTEKPGRVDLWPVVEKQKTPDPPDWDDPQDLLGEDHHVQRLARLIATQIKTMIDMGDPIVAGGTRRAVTPGDILILVQRRSPLFRAIIAALKAEKLPIAGVDRTEIAEPLAVQDLLALTRFLITPEDDLSLASVLKSPLMGWDEPALFDLAHGRDGYLWRALQDRGAEWPNTVAMLEDLRNHADYVRPYDLLERVLIRHDGRRRLIARLGEQADDAINAVLAQALTYEQTEVPSLTGFVGWLETGTVEIKRDLAQARGQIRVMTVHGAKGLEAPVVILPDTAVRRPSTGRTMLVQPANGPLIWARRASDMPEAVGTALADRAAADAAERDRLLYVAMTRAANWLIVAAAGDVGKDPNASWYATVADAMAATGAATPLHIRGVEGTGLRLETGDWGRTAPWTASARHDTHDATLPKWATRPAPRPPRDRAVRHPSDLGGAKVVREEEDQQNEDSHDPPAARLWGHVVHLLLEHLPHLPEPAWQAAAPKIAALATQDAIPWPTLDPMFEEAVRVLTHPGLSMVFGPHTLAEVEITGESKILDAPIIGVIDRLIVHDTRILAIDFKTNRAVPQTTKAVPEGLLRQMGAYAEILATIYPDRRIDTAILWSKTATLMDLPHDLTHAALVRSAVS